MHAEATAMQAAPPRFDQLDLVLAAFRAMHEGRQIIGDGPLGASAHEVSALLGLPVDDVRKSIGALCLAGELRDTGLRRKNAEGASAVVWTIVKETGSYGRRTYA